MSTFYSETIRMIEGSYQRIVTSIMLPPELYNQVEIQHSQLPDGVTINFQGVQMIVFGTPAIGMVGEWPVDVQLYLLDGTRLGNQAPLKIIIDSFEDLVFDYTSNLGISLGQYYYELLGGPLRQEMRDGV